MLATTRACNRIPLARAIHASASAAAKKKGKAAFEAPEFDYFEDVVNAEKKSAELERLEAAQAQLLLEQQAKRSQKTEKKKLFSDSGKLLPEIRAERFDKILKFLTPRLGRLDYVPRDPKAFVIPGMLPPLKPAGSGLMPQARSTSWLQLFQLATKEEQLVHLTTLFPGWVDSGRVWPERVTEAFVRRTEELHCPHLALKVFSEPNTYRFPITISAVRNLIHAFHREHPLKDLMQVVAIYQEASDAARQNPNTANASSSSQVKYRGDGYSVSLPPIWADLPACSMLLSACLDGKKRTRESIQLSTQLIPKLRVLLHDDDDLIATAAKAAKAQQELATPVPTQRVKYAVTSTHPSLWTPRKRHASSSQEITRSWVRWSLKRVERALRVSTRLRRPVVYVANRKDKRAIKLDPSKKGVLVKRKHHATVPFDGRTIPGAVEATGETAAASSTHTASESADTVTSATSETATEAEGESDEQKPKKYARPFEPRPKPLTLKGLSDAPAGRAEVPFWLTYWRTRARHVQGKERGGERLSQKEIEQARTKVRKGKFVEV